MKSILSEHERSCIAKLIETGLFEQIAVSKMKIGERIIVAPCSDGHQFADLYQHITGVCKEAVDTDLIHMVALNGGAMLMSGLLHKEEAELDGAAMFRSIVKAHEMKRGEDVFLYAHFPCGIAKLNGIGVIDQCNHLMSAKDRLKVAIPDLRVKCFFHVDIFDEVEGGTHKKRTYFLPKEMWANTDILMSVLREFKKGIWQVGS